MAQCDAKTRQGVRCKNEAVRQHLCAVHLGIAKARPSWWKQHRDAIKTGTEVAAGTAALLELIKAAVELWKCLPFGSAPTSPPDLRRLESELLARPRYPRMLKQHIPFTKSHESMAWTELVSIYDQGKQIRNEKDAERTADAFDDWISGRPEEYRELLNVFLEENLGKDK